MIVSTKTKHWMSSSKFYKLRWDIHYRCSDKAKWITRTHYFDKWIRVDRIDYNSFYNDMYESYVQKCAEIWERYVSIERNDNNKNYSKNNCIRIHVNDQSKNKWSNVYYEYDGIRDTLAWWSKRLWINRITLHSRIHDSWWSVDKALSTPKQNAFWNPSQP